MIFLIYLIGFVKRRNFLVIISIIITLTSFILYQVKGIILIPVIGAIIFRIYIDRLKISLKLLIQLIILGLVTFLVIYSIPYLYMGKYDDILTGQFFIDRINGLVSYLSSGILAFSAYLNSGVNFVNEPIIALIWNIIRYLSGWVRVDHVVNEYFFQTSKSDPTKTSNVFTIFGTIWAFRFHFNFA